MLVFRRVIVMSWAAVAALIVLGLPFSGPASAALAFPDEPAFDEPGSQETVSATLDCDFVLTDQGETLGDATPIVVAAEDLERFGDVRIRIFDQTPTGSLDEALSDRANACDWLDPEGNYRADFFLFGVSVEDRATRVLYGADWAPALDDSASVIIDRIINAQFAEGNYTGGVLGGIEQFASLRAEADGVSLDEEDVEVKEGTEGAEGADGIAPDTTNLSTGESGSEEPSDAPDESIPLTVETFPEVPEDSSEPADQAGEAAPEVTVESQDSNTGFYALVAGVLVAVTVLPALVLRRSRDSDVGDSAS